MKESKIKKLREKWSGSSKSYTSRNRECNDFGLDRYIDISNSHNKWKKLFILVFAINLILVGSIGYIANRNTYYPYIVEIDRQTGEIFSSTVLKERIINVNEKEIKFFINKFIVDTRTVTLDSKYFNEKIKETNYFLTQEVQKKLSYDLSSMNIKEMFLRKETKSIQVKSINKVSKNTYQVRWLEKKYDDNGILREKKNMNGIYNIDFFTPNDEKTIIHNPFGIVITDFNITTEQ